MLEFWLKMAVLGLASGHLRRVGPLGTNSFSFIDHPDTTIYAKKTAFFELFLSGHLLGWCWYARSVTMVKSCKIEETGCLLEAGNTNNCSSDGE